MAHLSNSPSLLAEHFLGVRGADDDVGYRRRDADLDAGVAFFSQLTLEEFVELGVEDTIGHKLAALANIDSARGLSRGLSFLHLEGFFAIGATDISPGIMSQPPSHMPLQRLCPPDADFRPSLLALCTTNVQNITLEFSHILLFPVYLLPWIFPDSATNAAHVAISFVSAGHPSLLFSWTMRFFDKASVTTDHLFAQPQK